MNATATTEIETDRIDGINIRVITTGITNRPRYMPDYSSIVERILEGLAGIQAMSGEKIGTIYTGMPNGLTEALDESTSATVEEQSFAFGMFINDEASYNAGEVVVPAVMHDDDQHVYLGDGYENVDWGSLDQARINRAKAKAKGRMNLYLLSDYYDEYPTADAAIVVNSGSNSGLDAIKDVRGANPWASTGGSAASHVVDLNVQNELLYALYLFDQDELSLTDMTQGQLEAIDTAVSTEEARKIGLEAHLEKFNTPAEQEAV